MKPRALAVTVLARVRATDAYLNVYATGIGQVVLAGVAISWAAAFWWLARMSEFIAPERFLAVLHEAKPMVPLVIRLSGIEAESCRALLEGAPLVSRATMDEAATEAVRLAS